MTGKFEPVPGKFKDTSEVPRGDNISYRCLKCGGIIPCTPEDSISCPCGNILIDRDMWILAIEDYDEFEVLKKI
jgi:hypothetical protein